MYSNHNENNEEQIISITNLVTNFMYLICNVKDFEAFATAILIASLEFICIRTMMSINAWESNVSISTLREVLFHINGKV